jgi:multidrug efflux system outer membrane protein
LRNLSEAALQSYLATQEGARSARIALVAETASAYATLAADQQLLAVSRDTLASAERTLTLTRSLNGVGLSGKLDVHQAETIVEQARSDVASAVTQVAQDRNAIDLLAGAPVEDALLPVTLSALIGSTAQAPAGMSSDILLQRPDVLEAEHRLQAANADIGAARAAMFPKISLTAAIGVASSALSSLFSGGAFSWSAAPSASLPIFGGGVRGNIE